MDDISPSREPRYLALLRSGELNKRVEVLEAKLKACDLCPRNCGINRLEGEIGFCHSGALPIVTSVVAHFGEEPVLSGIDGSGTIFFGNCNLQCVYCQNHQISQSPDYRQHETMSIIRLAEKMLYLQDELHCHNINLVSPTHFVPQIVKAVYEAASEGLRLPLVYNTGGYDSLETIQLLDGIVDIYLPDLKYASAESGKALSSAPDYPESARTAIAEMYRQVGDLKTDDDFIAVKGLIVRHLILPNRLAGSVESLTWLADEISQDITVSIMSQYYPAHKAVGIPELSRTITQAEYDEVVKAADDLWIENGWFQELTSNDYYRPDFENTDSPFE